MLRTARTSGGDATGRAAVRFEALIRPSAQQLANYRGGSITWDAISWVQGVYGSQTGLRQSWVRFELQLIPAEDNHPRDDVEARVAVFFGSAAVYYEIRK
jgi:hypothetical protein